MGSDVIEQPNPHTFGLRVDHRDNGVVVVGIDGELDSLTAPDAATHLLRGVAERSVHMIVDLSRTTFISSAGITVLLRARDGAERSGGTLHLVGVADNRVIERALDVTGVSTLFEIRATVAEALAG